MGEMGVQMNAKPVEVKPINDLEIKYLPRKDLIKSAGNARAHPEEQIEQIKASIVRFGWTNPILIDEDRKVIAGHGRLIAASRLNFDTVPTITLEGLTENEKRLYLLADNRIPINAAWDMEILKLEIADLQELGEDLTSAGFSAQELADFFKEQDVESTEAEKDDEQFAEQFAVVVICTDEDHQNETYDTLRDQGFNAKKATDK